MASPATTPASAAGHRTVTVMNGQPVHRRPTPLRPVPSSGTSTTPLTATSSLPPLYMWAGGKRRLLAHYTAIWPADRHLAYVEPFFGGGAVFGWRHIQRGPVPSHLGDINTELVDLLHTIQTDPHTFIDDVTELAEQFIAQPTRDERRRWYYNQRDRYWHHPTPALLYTLMRTSFNGIWQTCAASHGLFATPAGLMNQTSITRIIDPTLVHRWSTALADVHLHHGSYDTLPLPTTPALIYLDPPYRGSFTTYSTTFTDADQQRLAVWFRHRHHDGHTVILANRCVDDDHFFEDLLGDIADFCYFDVTYTAGRRKQTHGTFSATPAREFVAVSH